MARSDLTDDEWKFAVWIFLTSFNLAVKNYHSHFSSLNVCCTCSNTQQAAAAAGASQLTSPLSMSSSNGGGATSLPVIMIGTKLDQRNESERAYKKTYAQNKLATLLNCTQIHLVSSSTFESTSCVSTIKC